MRENGTSSKAAAGLIALAVLGAAARLIFLRESTWIEGDCSVLGLIAKHIAEGTEYAPYLWLAQYSGTLSAYITAVWFKLFGITPQIYQLTGFLFSWSHVVLVALMARRLLPGAGWYFAAALALLPTYETLSWMFLYQYGDSLALGCLVLLILMRDADGRDDTPAWLFGLAGLLSGLGMWTSPLFVPYLLTEGIVFLRRKSPAWKKELAAWFPCFLAGYSPAVVYNIRHPGAQMQRMAGRFFNVDRAEWAAAANPKLLLLKKSLLKILAIPGDVAHMPGQFAVMTNWVDCAVFALALIWALRERRGDDARGRAWRILWVFLACFFAYNAVLVGEPFPKFMFPLYIPFALLAADSLGRLWGRSRRAAALALTILVLPHLRTLAAGFSHPETMSVPELVDFLRERKIGYAYADYWISYPAMFQSKETIFISPTLLHPTFADRNPAYTERVRASENPALIVDRGRNFCAWPAIEAGLARLGVRYQKDFVKEFTVYHDFSRKIAPEELDLVPYMYCVPR